MVACSGGGSDDSNSGNSGNSGDSGNSSDSSDSGEDNTDIICFVGASDGSPIVEVGETVRIYSRFELMTVPNWILVSKPVDSSAVIDIYDNYSLSFVADIKGDYVVRIETSGCSDEIIITAATGIGGILTKDTILNFDDSPYIITDTIQIAYGITLTLEPGIKLYNGSIDLYGTLKAIGTENSRIEFNRISINPRSNKTNNEWAFADMDYINFNKGTAFSSSDGYNYISLKNSILIDMDRGVNLSRPAENSLIEKNIFINVSGGVTTYGEDAIVTIRNNVFYWAADSGNTIYGINNRSYLTVIENNTFITADSSSHHFYAASSAGNYANNYWGTVDISIIDSMILDRNDNLQYSDYIDYLPILTKPHPDTPDHTPYI